MKNCKQQNKFSEEFSFPSMPLQDHEMEFGFGSARPGSPNSPADHFFLNGRLMPHDFPCPPAKHAITLSRSTSRASSVCSRKDSLESSRSNSNSSNSRTSSCNTSARTSTSDTSERTVLIARAKTAKKTPAGRERYQSKRPLLTPHYESRRWQFIMAEPIPTHTVPRRNNTRTGADVSKAKKRAEGRKNGSIGCWTRLFGWFVSICNECHAIEPSRRECLPRKY